MRIDLSRAEQAASSLGYRELIWSPRRRQRKLPIPVAQPALDDVEDALSTA